MNKQPKACPFCGWGTIVDEAFLLPNKHICKCNACGARTRICRTWEDAVKLWNLRKGADDKEEFFREPTAEERKAVADYIDSISVPTGVNIFDLMDEPTISKMEQVDEDINVRSKEKPQTDCAWR